MKKQYIGIWMLLATAFVFLFALSVVGNTTLGAFELRTANIYDKLTYVEPEPEPALIESQTTSELPVIVKIYKTEYYENLTIDCGFVLCLSRFCVCL